MKLRLLATLLIAFTTITTLTTLVPTAAHAAPEYLHKSVLCDDPNTIFTQLYTQYGETPFWRGITPASTLVLLLNENTKTWTLVEFNQDSACILSSGQEDFI